MRQMRRDFYRGAMKPARSGPNALLKWHTAGSLGRELGPGSKGFQVVDAILDRAMDSFELPLIGMGRWAMH